MTMLNEQQINLLLERIYQRLNKLNQETLEIVGKRIKEIGTMSPSAAQKLIQLKSYGADIDLINSNALRTAKTGLSDGLKSGGWLGNDFKHALQSLKGEVAVAMNGLSPQTSFAGSRGVQRTESIETINRNSVQTVRIVPDKSKIYDIVVEEQEKRGKKL